MECFCIPFQDQFILYRPLRRLAFIGNRALADYVTGRLKDPTSPANPTVEEFLAAVGFWEADPPPPPVWRPTGDHHPTTAVLLLTTACNLRCTYCYARGGEGGRLDLPCDVALRVIQEAHRNSLAEDREQFCVSFHGGGEPTLAWDTLRACVEYARSLDEACHISLASNLTWSPEKLEFILRHLNSISVSFDGVPEVQNAQRPMADGSGSFDLVRRNLEALDEHGVDYGVRLTALPASFSQLPASVAWLSRETGCRGMQVEPCYTNERGEYADPDPEQARAFVDAFGEAFEVAHDAGVSFSYSGARPWVIAGAFCRSPESALVVTPEGDLVACYETYSRAHPLTGKFTLGAATASAVTVDGERVAAFARMQEQRRARCAGCFCYWHCGGDCASKCVASPRPDRVRCEVNRAITAELLAWHIAEGDGVWRGGVGHTCRQMRVQESAPAIAPAHE